MDSVGPASAPARHVPHLQGLNTLAGRFDALVCDIWGVIHNGQRAFGPALDCLQTLRADSVPVVLVTNAPKPHDATEEQLAGLGVQRGLHFDTVLTAGDLARAEALSRTSDRCYHLGPARDQPTLVGLEDRLTSTLARAGYILCTGLLHDDRETAADYEPLFREALTFKLPMICANPDSVVHRGEDEIPCAGLLAHAYEEMGGEVAYFGKPYPAIYDEALALIDDIRGAPVERSRVVALGDGLGTDIKGARDARIRSVFVTSGIHRDAVHGDHSLDQALQSLFEEAGFRPDWVIERLVW